LFKINQSVAEQMSLNKSFVVIKPRELIFPEQNTEASEPGKEKEAGENYIRNVKAEAARILEDARNEAGKIKENAWTKGFEDGKRASKQETDDFIREQANEARSIFSSLEKYKQELFSDLQDNVLALSFDIAEKIINIELEKDDKIYVGIVENAIQNLKAAEKFVLRVGRKEYDRFFKDGTQWLRDETGCVPFEIVCDPQMGEGGCILESGDRILNAGVQLQLSRIRHLLQEKADTE
jgi:flagellar assembly protein FliH